MRRHHIARGIALSVLVAGLGVVASARGQTEADAAKAAEPVMRQLEAFRRGDFTTAYSFASTEIHHIFDRDAFARMVTIGYPEIAHSVSAAVAESRTAPDGTVYLRLVIVGENGKSVEAIYEMIREQGDWKINGVLARPDPNLAAIVRPESIRA
jgi:uncharacterized protein DUF4864